ncbi:MAG TPA: FtsX-like permease family protein, partial [Puia sp.]
MLPTTWLIAFRRFRRNTAFSLLNILGLAVGLSASILIFLVIRWESSYDSYHPNKDRVYRVVTTLVNRSNGEVANRHGSAPVVLGDAVRNEVPGLEKTAMLMHLTNASIYYRDKGFTDEKRFMQRELCLAEPELFGMIRCEWLDGDASGLKDPNTAVIAESVARRWFGDWKTAKGKTVEMWSWRVPLKVVGVFRDLPGNTDLPLELVPSYITYKQQFPRIYTEPDWHWVSPGSQLFVMLSPGRNTSQVEAGLNGIVNKYYNEQVAAFSTRSVLSLQPLTKMHLDARFETLKGDALSIKVLWSLGAIGVFLVLVACINFINLATAQSVSRSKEVGIRKVLGSNRWQLIRQFMLETALITLIAMAIACLLVQLSLPYLGDLMQKPIVAGWLHSPALLGFLLLTGAGIVLLAGFYPAMMLSGFNVIEAIKSRINTRTIGGLSLRRSLVVIQFVIAQLLIMGTIVVVRQLKFFRTEPMGYDPTAIAILQMPSDSADALRQPYLK